jgi:dihydroorotate dehydrogenase
VHADMVEDYCRMVGAFADCADGVELGLRCPNTASRVSIYPIPKLDELLGAIRQQNAATPIFVKLPPYADAQEKENRLELVERVIHFGCAGVTVPGNWPVEDKRLSKGRGSISGPSVFANNLEVVRAVAGVARRRIAIKATGGISTGADAFQMLAAGATMLDLFSVFVYRGWAAAELIKSELLALMDAQGFANIAELQASGAAKAAQLDRREGFAQAPTRAAS